MCHPSGELAATSVCPGDRAVSFDMLRHVHREVRIVAVLVLLLTFAVAYREHTEKKVGPNAVASLPTLHESGFFEAYLGHCTLARKTCGGPVLRAPLDRETVWATGAVVFGDGTTYRVPVGEIYQEIDGCWTDSLTAASVKTYRPATAAMIVKSFHPESPSSALGGGPTDAWAVYVKSGNVIGVRVIREGSPFTTAHTEWRVLIVSGTLQPSYLPALTDLGGLLARSTAACKRLGSALPGDVTRLRAALISSMTVTAT
jgi:hypothetical protein